MGKITNKASTKLREQAVRLGLDNEGQHASRWQAISAKIGCTPQTLNDWVNKTEVESGKRAVVPTDMAERRLSCTNRQRDSSREFCVVAGRHEQTETPDLQDPELARL